MKSGIYKITNSINKKFYIGSAKNLNSRKTAHFYNLSKNKHCNNKLQNSYNKHGKENFIFEILVVCPVEYLIKMEQWFIDNMKPQYNICQFAGNTLGQKMKPHVKEALKKAKENYVISEETKKKLSEALVKRVRKKETYDKSIKTRIERYGNRMISEKASEKLKNTPRSTKGKTLEEILGKDKAKEVKNKQRIKKLGSKRTEETKKKMSESGIKRMAQFKGKTLEEVYGEDKAKSIKLKLSQASKTDNVKKARIEGGKKLKGKKQTEEHKNKRAASKSKPIKVTNLLDNSFTIYKGILDFSKSSGFSEAQIINVLKKDGIMKYKKLKIQRL